MGWTSQDDLINQLTNNGKGDTVVTTKTLSSAGTAGAWTLLAGHAGYPPAATFTGTDLTSFQACYDKQTTKAFVSGIAA